jgi:capsular polysaccharide biosynthesis protein
MSAVTFDTLKFVKELENAGMPQAQAEAQAKALANVLSESLDTTLATKADIQNVKTELKSEIQDVKSEIKLMKWMLGFLVGGMVFILLRLYVPVQ